MLLDRGARRVRPRVHGAGRSDEPQWREVRAARKDRKLRQARAQIQDGCQRAVTMRASSACPNVAPPPQQLTAADSLRSPLSSDVAFFME